VPRGPESRFPLLTEGKLFKFETPGPPEGIDHLAVTWKADEVDTRGWKATVPNWGESVFDQDVTYSRELEGGGHVFAGIGGVVRWEGSLPKRAGGENVDALRLVPALTVARGVYDELAEVAELSVPFEEGTVTRIDLVRDFDDVDQFELWSAGVQAVRHDRRVRTFRHASHEFKKALTVGASARTSWSGYCYDKHAESEGRAPEGRVRFEARLRKGSLRSEWAVKNGGKVVEVRDLTVEKLEGLRRATFRRVGFDREVLSMRGVAERVLQVEGLSDRQRMGFLGYVWGQAAGVELCSRTTAWRYEKLASELGVAVPRELLTEDAAVAVSLDYDSGRQVVRAA
jgi:hypothetical protein